ncbi:hypothetical protein DV736_g671, partial [Chaetothyriales sp. CBS 134916]
MIDSLFTTPTKRRRLASPLEIPSKFLTTAPTDETPDKLTRSNPLPEGYPCATCGKIWRTESDFKKDQARHERPHKCNVDRCPRMFEGFSTINDLNRHLKAVHGVTVEGTIDYKCLVTGCAKPDKTWPRLDNFRQHIIRMHPDQDVDRVVKQSRQWFHNNPSNLARPSQRARVTRPRPSQTARRRHSVAASVTPEQSRHSNGLDPRQPSLSSATGGTPNTERQLSTPPRSHQMATESYGTPIIPAADPSDRYTVPVDDNPTRWVQQQDETFNGVTSDPAPMSYLEGLLEIGGENYRLEHLDPSPSQNSLPRIEVSPPTEATAAAYQQRASDPYFSRADSVLTKLQLALADSNPPAGNAPDIVMKHGFQSHSAIRDSADDSQDTSVFTFATFSGHSSTAPQLTADNEDQGMESDGSLNAAGTGMANIGGPERYVACPFNKHDGIVYAACQGYRAKTVNELYLQHILPYHTHRGHIAGPVLARLANLSGSTTGEHWYALYRELFIGEPGIDQLHLPGPFWEPAVSTTNLDDLVRAVVNLSGQGVSIPNARQTTQPTNMSLAPFHLRVQKMRSLIHHAANTELAQVRRRWEAVRTEAMTRLATDSQFDPRILYDFSATTSRSQPHSEVTNTKSVRPARLPGTHSVAYNTSPDDLLDLTDSDFSPNMPDFPFPLPTATPSNMFGNRAYEMARWSRRSTPNDSGYVSNFCKWLAEDDDPELCRLCGKTRDLHDIEFVQRQH